jgi:hypothetical protein
VIFDDEYDYKKEGEEDFKFVPLSSRLRERVVQIVLMKEGRVPFW